MMQLLLIVALLVVSYLIGAIPSGMIVVKLRTGKDLRQVESGRTGGTNAARAAGWPAGVITGVTDFFKGAIPVFLARAAGTGDWVLVGCGLAAILGHNYSIFLAERDDRGRLHLKGGAGGATCMGGAFGLWPPSLLIILPLSMAIIFALGYASVGTMSMAGIAIAVFGIGAMLGYFPAAYVFYGIFAELILMWALRPNIRRLSLGTERLVGWRAWRQKAKQQQHHA